MREKFNGRKREAEKGMRLLRALGPSKLQLVASGSAAHDLLLGDGRVGSQVVGVDLCRLLEEQLENFGKN